MAVFNAKPRILSRNVFDKGTLIVTGTDPDPQYNKVNVHDQKLFTFWKAAAVATNDFLVDLNKVLNPGFETGDYTGWTANSAVIDGAVKHSGSWSSKLVSSGSDVNGAKSDLITVDPLKTYRAKGQFDVTWTAGNYRVRVAFYDSGDNVISAVNLVTKTSSTAGFEGYDQSIGPAGSGADISYPAGTVKVDFRDLMDGTPTITAYLDDVLFYEEIDADSMGIAAHNLWGANATVTLFSSVDDTETMVTFATQIAGFTPDSNKLIYKEFTQPGTPQRGWLLRIATANVVPFIGDMRVGERLTFPRWVRGPFGSRPRQAMGELSENKDGQFIQRVDIRAEVPVSLGFTNVQPSFVWDELMPEFEDVLKKGIFYFIWDKTNYPDQAMVCYIPDGFTLDPKFTGAVMSFQLRVVPIPEITT